MNCREGPRCPPELDNTAVEEDKGQRTCQKRRRTVLKGVRTAIKGFPGARKSGLTSGKRWTSYLKDFRNDLKTMMEPAKDRSSRNESGSERVPRYRYERK